MPPFISKRLARTIPIFLLTQLASVGLPETSEACGGLFCSASTPVNQAAERILFAQSEEGTITQIVEIQYEGPAEKFAWVLPVPGIPDFDVSSSVIFDRLQQATNPQYLLVDSMPDSCGGFGRGGLVNVDAGAAGGQGNDDGGSGITVLVAGSVGPFDYEVISVDAASDDAAEVAIEWLEDNGYDVGALGPEVLRPYLANGLNLLAFRLQKGVDTGAIQPVQLRYEAMVPAIPIRPTAVAANDDMGIMVWLLGPARGVPTNYKGLELNELFIDWINPNNNYNQVVTLAADEAGGQGFVTEFAGLAAPFHDVVDPGFDRVSSAELGQFPVASTLEQLANRFANYDGFARVFSEHVTLREPLTTDDFLSCAWCYFEPQSAGWNQVDYGTYDDMSDPILETDIEALVAAVDHQVLRPIREAADLFISHPYVTRLYTTMSASEMDLDPVFDFNPDLEDVSNIHTADRALTCEGAFGPWRVTLPDGRKVYGEGNTWPIVIGEADLPFNTRVVTFGISGAPDIETDNTAFIAAAFSQLPASEPNAVERRSRGGCDFGGTHPRHGSAGWLVLGAMVLAWRGRRRTTGSLST